MLYLLVIFLTLCFGSAQTAPGVETVNCNGDCTYSHGYWKNHNPNAGCNKKGCNPDSPLVREWPAPYQPSTLMCGKPFIEWLSFTGALPYGKFAREYVAATLNIAEGRCDPSNDAVLKAVYASSKTYAAMCECAVENGCSASESALKSLHTALENYNTGGVSGDHCGSEDGETNPPTPDTVLCSARQCRLVEICEFDSPVVCEEVPETCEGGCTYTIGCWRVDTGVTGQQPCNSLWPVGGHDRTLCGERWYDIMNGAAGNDKWRQLAQQWIAASLNVEVKGACQTPTVADDMQLAENLLNDYCAAVPPGHNSIAPGSADHNHASGYQSTLSGFNEGSAGPAHC